MTSEQDFSFTLNWTDVASDPTSARFKLEAGGCNLFRAENRWSQSVDDMPHLSALPVARWLAQSWWRLRWELAAGPRPSHGWRMAHEIAAAGEGFLWPRVSFVSDGQSMQVDSTPSDGGTRDMLRYLQGAHASIPVAKFEDTVDLFIETVIERAAGTVVGRELAGVWSEVLAERRDPQASLYRRTEAVLGFDPDDAPSAQIEAFLTAFRISGADAGLEIAAVLKSHNPAEQLEAAFAEIRSIASIAARITQDITSEVVGLDLSSTERAVVTGRRLAIRARVAADISAAGPVMDSRLTELMGIRLTDLEDPSKTASSKLPFTLAQTSPNGEDRILFKSKNPQSRRFSLARLLCDTITRRAEFWHPATDSQSARQKLQRAFASEFLAPIAALADYLSGQFDEDSQAGAAEYFDVAQLMIRSQLANNGLIPAF